jgi:hypothetical protein
VTSSEDTPDGFVADLRRGDLCDFDFLFFMDGTPVVASPSRALERFVLITTSVAQAMARLAAWGMGSATREKAHKHDASRFCATLK